MRHLVATLVLAALPLATLAADQWPQWRGPRSIAVSAERGLPAAWSATENVASYSVRRSPGSAGEAVIV